MASPGNQHCVSCIGTLSFHIEDFGSAVASQFNRALGHDQVHCAVTDPGRLALTFCFPFTV